METEVLWGLEGSR